ncbi:MAG: 54S ribosomal protein L23, mitochondrial [Marteilia pararefringens]
MSAASRWITAWKPLWQRQYKLPDADSNGKINLLFPHYWIRILNDKNIPPSILKIEAHIQMTKYDIKEYLEKLYRIPVMGMRTQIFQGKLRKNYVDSQKPDQEEPDYKYAWVELPHGYEFRFPEIEQEVNRKAEELTATGSDKKEMKNAKANFFQIDF